MQNTPVLQLIDEAENIAIKGSLCQKEGQLEEAVFYYKQALNENPNLQQVHYNFCLLYTSPSPRDATLSRMPSSA